MNNIAVLMVISLALLALAYRFYGRFVARRLGIDPAKTTPAHTINDGVDYVPTKPLVLDPARPGRNEGSADIPVCHIAGFPAC